MGEADARKNMKKIVSKIWKIWLIIIGSILVTGLAVGIFAWWALQPVALDQTTTQTFIVPKGQAVKIIGQRLESAGLIKHQLLFSVAVKWLQTANKIQAGSFQISPSWTVAKIAQELTKGTEDVWLTIPEGWRREQIADYLASQDLAAFDKTEFLKLTKDKEGQLFPDTYLVPRLITAPGLVAILDATYQKRITLGLEKSIAAATRPLPEIIVLASILEREAGNKTQMRQVAGVLENRLKIKMPLQVDATLQYIKGYSQSEKNWWATPLAVDKQLKSPYNTYLNPGLPPWPISNPGVAAIEAALNPLESDYLFYLHDQGKIYLARTLSEHNANVAKYLR